MFRVSEAQFAALEAHYADAFVQRMVGVLFESFPRECKQRGRKGVLASVRASVARVREEVGAKLESDFRLWVVIEFLLGVEATRELCEAQKKRLLLRDGETTPSRVVIATYYAMFGRIAPRVEPEPDPEYFPLDADDPAEET